MISRTADSKKNLFVVIILFAVLLGGIAVLYFLGFLSGGEADSGMVSKKISAEQLKSRILDTSLFKNEKYKNLRDYSVELPPIDTVPVGKNNPFEEKK